MCRSFLSGAVGICFWSSHNRAMKIKALTKESFGLSVVKISMIGSLGILEVTIMHQGGGRFQSLNDTFVNKKK